MMLYDEGEGKYKDWILSEDCFDLLSQGKCESIMYLSNGYIGIRSAFEESYPYQTRGTFIANTFNSFYGEVTELPNVCDCFEMDIRLDGEPFSMMTDKVKYYRRSLNIFTGEVTRKVIWQSDKNREYEITFRRFASFKDLHVFCQSINITPKGLSSDIEITSSLNGRMTNSGVQHFKEGTSRVFDDEIMVLSQRALYSNIDICHGSVIKTNIQHKSRIYSRERRKLSVKYKYHIPCDNSLIYERFNVSISNNLDEYKDNEELTAECKEYVEKLEAKTYEELFTESKNELSLFWDKNDIKIDTTLPRVQLSIRYAIMSLKMMMPAFSGSSIGAKALSGEGYKGHVFWDTEVFPLPYCILSEPKLARRLLEYRVNLLDAARENAKKGGYEGARFPWESADSGKEETPMYAGINVLTGKPARVWSGDKEIHITSDVAYSVWKYFQATNDMDFMKKGGAELIINCALFWISRAYYNEKLDRFEILDVIGPDEYTEHINNNFYTNYMARFNCEIALKCLDLLDEEEKKAVIKSVGEEYIKEQLTLFIDKLYLPEMKDGIIPQDDTFLDKPVIDIEKYKNCDTKQTILLEYSREQVNNLRVLKQPDVIMLLHLMRDRFSDDVKRANWYYYEEKTINDSSLSPSIHCITACDFNDADKALTNFMEAIDVDMGANMKSSDAGIHAAAMGGIWKAVIEGFAGIYYDDKTLYVKPCVPQEIQSISFNIMWKNAVLYFTISSECIQVRSDNNCTMVLNIKGSEYLIHDLLKVKL